MLRLRIRERIETVLTLLAIGFSAILWAVML